jgi:hypothetical protein
MLKIKIHSFSDVITNSSDSIYMSVTNKGVGILKELIDFFLKSAGSDKKADDLFEFKQEFGDTVYDRLWWNLENEIDGEVINKCKSMHYLDRQKFQKEVLNNIISERKSNINTILSEYDIVEDNTIFIIEKDNRTKVIDVAAKVNEIFNIVNVYE